MTLKKILSLSTVVAAMFVAAQASATIVTLDPAANNGGAGTLSATNAAFPTDKGTTNFASLLDIASLPGASGPSGLARPVFSMSTSGRSRRTPYPGFTSIISSTRRSRFPAPADGSQTTSSPIPQD